MFIHCASGFSVSCAGLLETESIWGERQASLGNLHSCRVRDGSKKSKQYYRDVLLKEPLSSSPLYFSHPHTHAGKGSWGSRNKLSSSLRPNYHRKSYYLAEKYNSSWAAFFVLLTHLLVSLSFSSFTCPPVFHPVECSYCHSESMLGFRYRCQQCHNYQLCQDCFWRGHAGGSHSNQHQMKEYTSWVSWMCECRPEHKGTAREPGGTLTFYSHCSSYGVTCWVWTQYSFLRQHIRTLQWYYFLECR